MALFEVEDGHLIPAQFGYPVADEMTPDLVDAICGQVLEIVSRPLFPITWRDMSRTAEDDDTPRLTSLDSSGQVVSVEVVSHLDSAALISSLSRLAETASLSWTDLAAEYPTGVDGFKAGWIQFRDSMPPSTGAGPRLVMVVGSIDPQVRPALDVLVSSGVEVHEMSLRRMSNGRTFIEVQAVGPRFYGHAPQVVLGRSGQIPEIPALDEAEVAAATTQTVEADSALRVEPAAGADATEEEPVLEEPIAESEEVGAVDAPESQDGDAEPGPVVDADDTSAAACDAAGYSAQEAPAESDEVIAAREDGVPVLARDEEGLRALGQIIGEDMPLVGHSDLGLSEDIQLTSSGRIAASGLEFNTPDEFLGACGFGDLDGWVELRIADWQGPTLAESLNEVNVEIVREYSRGPRRSGGGRHGA